MWTDGIGWGAGHKGKRTAREAHGEALDSDRLLREKVRGTRHWKPRCINPAKNYSLETGSGWSSRNNWRDLICLLVNNFHELVFLIEQLAQNFVEMSTTQLDLS